MKRQHRKMTILLLLAVMNLMIMPQPAAAQSQAPDRISVLFILDDSGSMAGNDPGNLRYTAARLFMAALDDQDEVAAIRFSSQSQIIINGFTPIGNSGRKVDLINTLTPVEADGYTDVKAAFITARDIFETSESNIDRKIVIFLTDGKPEIAQPYAGYEEEALQAAAKLKVPVYAIALTFQGQSAFLNQVANQTGGKVIPAKNANDLLDSFLQILGDVKDRTIVGQGMDRSPGESIVSLDPALMPYVSKATFIVSHDSSVSVSLYGPEGSEIRPDSTAVSFSITSDPGFKAYTVSTPASGNWRFELKGSGNAQVRVILHSRLRMKILSPSGLIEAGKATPLIVNLIEEQEDGSIIKVVGDASFSALVTLPDETRQSLDAFYDDGSHGDRIAGDGNYTREFVDTVQAGTYHILIQGYKGMVPVNTNATFEAIPFPDIGIDEPVNQKYEIRSNSVPLKIHLSSILGTESFEGELIGQITSPSGQVYKVPLTKAGDFFQSEFLPIENGLYRVLFKSENSHFMGMPFEEQVEGGFESILFSEIYPKSIQLGLNQSNPGNRFELHQAFNGIPMLVQIQSSSKQIEQIIPNLENLPGFSLEETGPVFLPPETTTTITLHIIGDQDLAPGTFEGALHLTPQGTVDIVNNRMPIKFDVFQPQINLTAEAIAQSSDNQCWNTDLVRLLIQADSNSVQPEMVNISISKIEQIEPYERTLEIQPGHNEIEIELNLKDALTPGNYSGEIQFANQREGVEINPEKSQSLIFTIDSLWVRCKKPLILSGFAVMGLGMIMAAIVKKRMNAKKPPIISGTLNYWHKDSPEMITEIDLTALKKSKISIGRGVTNDVVLMDDTVETTHVRITAEKVDDTVRLTLEPDSKIRKGYRDYETPIPLEENVTYQIGNHVMKYIGDLTL